MSVLITSKSRTPDDYIHLAKTMQKPSMQEQITKEWSDKWKLAFRRVGCNDTTTMYEWIKINQQMVGGKCPSTQKGFYLDQWEPYPAIVNRFDGLAIRHSRIKWTYMVNTSHLKFTPHALGQFRMRTGYFVDDSVCWDIPYICNPLMKKGSEESGLTSYLLPTTGEYFQGAWLGHSTAGRGGNTETYRYKRGKLFNYEQSDGWGLHFICMTYINDWNMSRAQQEITRAYRSGDYERYDALNRENALKFPKTIDCYKNVEDII